MFFLGQKGGFLVHAPHRFKVGIPEFRNGASELAFSPGLEKMVAVCLPGVALLFASSVGSLRAKQTVFFASFWTFFGVQHLPTNNIQCKPKQPIKTFNCETAV